MLRCFTQGVARTARRSRLRTHGRPRRASAPAATRDRPLRPRVRAPWNPRASAPPASPCSPSPLHPGISAPLHPCVLCALVFPPRCIPSLLPPCQPPPRLPRAPPSSGVRQASLSPAAFPDQGCQDPGLPRRAARPEALGGLVRYPARRVPDTPGDAQRMRCILRERPRDGDPGFRRRHQAHVPFSVSAKTAARALPDRLRRGRNRSAPSHLGACGRVALIPESFVFFSW